jgi:outer membrane protein TolC
MDIQEKMDDIGDSDNDFPYDKLEVLAKQAKEQKQYTKDQIEQDITTKYNSLIDKEKALDKLKKQIQIRTKQINDTNLKKNLGLVTSIDVKNAEMELEKLKNSQKLKENQLKNSQDFFQVITGKYVSQYSLEDTQPLEPFRITGDVDAYFDGVIDKYKKYDKKLLELTKDNLKDNKVDKPDDDAPKKSDYEDTLNEDGSIKTSAEQKYEKAINSYKGEWTSYGSYLEQKFGYSTDVYTLNETKKGLKNGLKESYANLLDMENSIKVMQTNIAVKNKELANSKLKYDMGLITKTDYNNLVLDNDELENSLRTAVNNYNTLKNQIQKPWISAGGAASAN